MKSRIRELLTTWNVVRVAALLAWAGWVIWQYYLYHPGYVGCGDSLMNCVSSGGWLNLLTYVLLRPRMYFIYFVVGLYAAWSLWRGKKDIKLCITPAHLLIWMYLFAIVAINLLFFFHPAGGNPGVAFFFAQPSIFTKIGLLLVIFSLTILVGLTLGTAILNRAGLKAETRLHEFLYALTTGWIVLVLLFFILAALHALFTVIAVPLVLICMVLLRKECAYWIRIALSHQWNISFPVISLEAFSLLVLHVLLSISLYESLTPFPTNWDGMYRYINTVNLLEQGGGHISGVFPYPFELLMSSSVVLFKSMTTAISYTWFSIWLAGLAFYVYMRTFCNRSIASLLTTALFCIPFVFYLMSMETKVDFAAVLYVLVALLAVAQWQSSKKSSWLWLAAVLMGFACTIKLTTSFVIPGILLMVAILAWQQKKSWKQIISSVVIMAAITVTPLLPWMAKNIVESGGTISIPSLLQGKAAGPDLGVCQISDTSHYTSGGNEETISRKAFTGHYEEMGRYWGYEKRSWREYISLPWTLTMNLQIGHPLVQIGPLFLALLPAFLLVYRKRGNSESKVVRWRLPIAAAMMLTWILWFFGSEGIIWYGLSGIILYLALIGLYWQTHEHNRLVHWTFATISIACILVSLLYRFTLDPQPSKIHYLSGFKTTDELLYQDPPELQKLADEINADAPTPEDQKYVYNTGSYLVYRIKNNDSRIYRDDFMDSLTCLLDQHDGDEAATLEDLKARGFKYFVFNPGVVLIDETPEQSLVGKGRRVSIFITHMTEAGKLERIALSVQQHLKHVAFKISE